MVSIFFWKKISSPTNLMAIAYRALCSNLCAFFDSAFRPKTVQLSMADQNLSVRFFLTFWLQACLYTITTAISRSIHSIECWKASGDDWNLLARNGNAGRVVVKSCKEKFSDLLLVSGENRSKSGTHFEVLNGWKLICRTNSSCQVISKRAILLR